MELAAIVSRQVVDEILQQDLAPYELVLQENGNQDDRSRKCQSIVLLYYISLLKILLKLDLLQE